MENKHAIIHTVLQGRMQMYQFY